MIFFFRTFLPESDLVSCAPFRHFVVTPAPDG
jgi:hypothetical protein